MQLHTRGSDFYVVPFSIDGQAEGMDRRTSEKLSDKWLNVCKEFLELHGTTFDSAFGGALRHIRLKVTSHGGAALATFSVNARTAASIALASGIHADAESELLELFLDSLRRVTLVQQTAASRNPFRDALSIDVRPVMFVVPWPDSEIADQDHELVRELALHLASTFFAQTS